MSLLGQILSPRRILFDVAAQSKQALFTLIADRLADDLDLPAAAIANSLIERESLGSTGLGHAIAIPHGRIRGLSQASAAVARLAAPISFGAPDGAPVELVVILLVPQKATDLHLQILSELAQLLSDRKLRDRVLASHDANEIHRLLSGNA